MLTCCVPATWCEPRSCYQSVAQRAGGWIVRLFFRSVLLSMVLASPALAADLPVPKRPVVAPVYDWSGFYIGGGTGGVWNEANRFMPDLPLVGVPPTTFTAHSSDWIYNVPTAGVQGQWGRWVIGVEAAYNGSQRDMRADVSVSPPEPFSKLSATTLVTDLTTAGVRVGYTWDRLMVVRRRWICRREC